MSSRYLVSYDLHKKNDKKYKAVASAIQACGDCIEVQESVWFVYSDSKRDHIVETVGTALSDDDKLIVMRIAGIYHKHHAQEVGQWLTDHPVETDKK
jgi:hypothetical protein